MIELYRIGKDKSEKLQFIPKGYATPSLLVQIITSKYQYGLPFYRQESLFKQSGIEFNHEAMADLMIRFAEIFKPL